MMAVKALGVRRYEMESGDRFTRHVHRSYHQLAWASSGTLLVDVDGHCWLLPTTLALWIPAGTWHVMVAVKEAVMHGIYLPLGCRGAWDVPVPVSVSPLARHLIDHLGSELADSARRDAQSVLLDVLRPTDRTVIEVPMPTDLRAREIAELLLANPSDPRNLDELGSCIGVSARTVQRLFLAETALTFTAWRTHARLQAALPLLADGQTVASVAKRVGYGSPSAFVAAFRRVTGHTPAAYFSAMG